MIFKYIHVFIYACSFERTVLENLEGLSGLEASGQ